MTLQFQCLLDQALPNNFDESLLEKAHHSAQAVIWQGSQGLVMPRTYNTQNNFEACQAHFESLAWPLTIRQSGGGVVPQGPGIINLSLAWKQFAHPIKELEQTYQYICQPIQQALKACGIDSQQQEISGSFCDGRFNLTSLHKGTYKKIVGTAQIWKRTKGAKVPEHLHSDNKFQTWHLVFAHALILMDVNIEEVTQKTNELESFLNRPARYTASRMVNLKTLGVMQEQFINELSLALKGLQLPHQAISL